MKIKIIATIIIMIFIVGLLSGCVGNPKTETQVTPGLVKNSSFQAIFQSKSNIISVPFFKMSDFPN
jgi:PBP1b-binding outer membrane lipoprotein LpoB